MENNRVDKMASSRIFVQGIPPNMSAGQLKKHFSKQGVVTDAKTLGNRRIGYIGYNTAEEAAKALKYYNKSYLRLSKLSVEFARPASQYESKHHNQITIPSQTRKREDSSEPRKRKRQLANNDVERKSSDLNADVQPTYEDATASAERSYHDFVDRVWLQAHKRASPDEEQVPHNVSADRVPEIEHPDNVTRNGDNKELKTTKTMHRDAIRGLASQKPFKRLFLRNLSYTLTEQDIREEFALFGDIDEIHVPVNSAGIGKGFAFVQYFAEEDAEKALKAMDDSIFHGRLLQVLASEPKRSKYNEFELSRLPLKQQVLIRRKAESTSKVFSWNSLYMNSDAVITYISDRLGVTKAEVLDPSSSDAAIIQARAESHVIEETKRYFLDCGVDLDAFRNALRGDTGILVKNLSYGSSGNEVLDLFADYGEIERFLMPPSGVTAIVAFQQAAAAKVAFKALSFRKFRESILFLEWAPKKLFTSASVARIDNNTQRMKTTPNMDDEISASEAESSTLYVCNINFTTTNTQLTNLFQGLSGFLSATIKTKPDPEDTSKTLSMGYGFLEFRTRSQAKSAMDAMQGYVLGGHSLVIKVSEKAKDTFSVNSTQMKNVIKQRKSKIIVKNLPFEVSKEEIRSLFSSYGQLRSLRIPKKIDKSSRGFAFVEFTTTRDAENAMEALKHTHVLGRRLILQFAAEDVLHPEEEIEKMQKKVTTQIDKITLKNMTSSKRKKIDLQGIDEA